MAIQRTKKKTTQRTTETKNIYIEDVEWIVNEYGELGVRIDRKCFFLYKGESLVYEDGLNENGKPMMVRTVGKREFGECCHPIWNSDMNKWGTISLDDCERWEIMSPEIAVKQAKEIINKFESNI